MENASYIGLSLQTALRRQMDVIANNMANINTTGFRGQYVLFEEYLADAQGTKAEASEPVSLVNDFGTYQDLAVGPLTRTGNTLDVALDGPGYLVVEGPGGPRYTRAGVLQMDADGTLVDRNGLPLLDRADGRLEIPPGTGAITIGTDGTVTADGIEVGQLQIVDFERPQFLTPIAGGLYVTDEAPIEAAEVSLRQGFVEGSNVNPIVEMTRMIEVMRRYQSNQRLLEGEHERMRNGVNTLGSLQ